MGTCIGSCYKEVFNIKGESVTVVADFAELEIRVFARMFNQTFTMDEYNSFTGDMKEFASEKIHG